MPTSNVVIYARYSSDNQREESIEGQLRECRVYAERNDMKIIGSYIDRALSAKTDARPQFQKMIQDSNAHRFQFVLVWKLDRFSRNRFDSAYYKRALSKNNVITAIGTLPTKDATLAEIEEIDAVTTRVNALLKDEEVPQAKITNYADYQKAVDAKAATEKAIADVKAQIEALPDGITLEQSVINQIYAAKSAAQNVQDTYGDDQHQALDDATLAKLKKANGDLETLTVKFANLVEDIGLMVNAGDVTLGDKADIENLRERVNKMVEEDKATFDAAEMNRLTAAEEALAALQTRSGKAHKAVAALPGADTVKLTEKADIEALNKEIAALETKGDSFNAAEKQKLADAQKGITDLEKAQTDMKATLESLKDDKDVRYDDKAAEEKLSADIEALQDRGVAVDETTVGVNGWKRYTRYAAAVKAMNSELTGLNRKMQTELDSWTYPYDIAKYDALRKDMDAAAKKYGMTEEQTKAEFTNYETDKIQAAAAEEKIKQANAKIKALPATITKAQEQDVAAITAIVNELKAAPYKMTDSALQTALGSNYATYTKAFACIANELGIPTVRLSSEEMNHAWNLVQVDGNWYEVDCTWDDTEGADMDYGFCSYKYFMRSENDFANKCAHDGTDVIGFYDGFDKNMADAAVDKTYDNAWWVKLTEDNASGIMSLIQLYDGDWYFAHNGVMRWRDNLWDGTDTFNRVEGDWWMYGCSLIGNRVFGAEKERGSNKICECRLDGNAHTLNG